MMDFDRLLTSAPINRQAALHLSRDQGDHREYQWNGNQIASVIALPWRAPNAEEAKCPTFSELSGITYGRLRVLGIFDSEKAERPVKGGNGQKWVVRCACGYFEVRKARSIRAQTASCCQSCAHNAKLREMGSSVRRPDNGR